jgi:DNA ligase 1
MEPSWEETKMSDGLLKVCETFDKIQADPGRLAKEGYLRELTKEEETNRIAQELLSIGLDWYRHFKVRFLPQPTHRWDYGVFGWSEYLTLVYALEGGEREDRQRIANFLASYPPVVEKWLRACLLKDLQMGVSSVTANKVWPNCVKTFSVMLADTLYHPENLRFPVALEPKIDGVRCIATVRDRKIDFVGRSGNELYHIDRIANEIQDRRSFDRTVVIDGELFAGSFPETMQVVRRSTNLPDSWLHGRLVFHAFDLLEEEEWDSKKCVLPYIERRERMHSLLSNLTLTQIVPMEVTQDLTQFAGITGIHLAQGHEGSMVKDFGGPYIFDRSSAWLKWKPVNTGDFQIVATYGGSGKFKGMLGGVVVKLDNGNLCKVGGGFLQDQRQYYWEHQDKIIGKVIEVAYKWYTPDGMLREPVFVRLREDKS